MNGWYNVACVISRICSKRQVAVGNHRLGLQSKGMRLVAAPPNARFSGALTMEYDDVGAGPL